VAHDKQFGMRVIRWIQRQMPTREQMERNKWLRPIAHRVLAPELWRFTRRSVPRGVALGMVAGVIIPIAQIPAAAAFALPLRANIPAAAATTFITNPATTPIVWVIAYRIGRWLLRWDAEIPGQPMTQVASDPNWVHWFMAEAGPATIVGLLFLALVGAVLGYALSAIGWRLFIANKWRRRNKRLHRPKP